MKKFLALTALAVMLSVAACGKKKDADVAKAAAASPLLAYVPADAPYVYGALAPTPDDVADKLEPLFDAAMPALKSQLEVAMEAVRAEAEPGSEQLIRIMEAVTRRLTPDIGKTFGFSRKDTVVFYGNGLLPVARATLTDPDRFEAELTAIAAEIEVERIEATVGDVRYERIPLGDGASLLIGREGNQLVVAIAPSNLDESSIGELVGATKPAQSIVDGGALKALAAKYGYLPQGMGFIDIEAIAGVFLDGPTGLDAKFIEATGGETPELSDECRSEIRSLTTVVPRLALGYQRLDTDAFQMLPVMELRDDIAKGLQPVAGNVPGLNTPGDGLMKFALALDLKALRTFVEGRVDSIMASPFQCPELGQLNLAAQQAQQGLQQPLPPIAYNFKGLVLDIENVEGIDFENPGMPEDLDLSMLLAFDNVSALLQMGQMMLPPLAQMEISPDGEAVAVPKELLQGYPSEVWAAMTSNLLAFSTGAGSESRAASMVAAEADGDPAVMAMSIDMAAYMGFMADIQESVMSEVAAESADSEDDDAARAARMLEASMESNKAMQTAYGKVFDRETMHIRITPNGFELPTTITLK